MSLNFLTAPVAAAARPQPHRLALIADRRPLAARLREALRAATAELVLLTVAPDRLAAAATAEDLDVIIVAPAGAVGRCLRVFKETRALFARVPIVGIWPSGQRIETQAAMRTGIDGLLGEGQIESALAPMIQAVRLGLVCAPRRRPLTAAAESLSSREKQVLAMLIMGFTNAEIGQRLYLAESTVKSHVSSAYMKLGVRSRKDAAALILDPHTGLGTEILAISGSPSVPPSARPSGS